jgi:hypothetical protein
MVEARKKPSLFVESFNVQELELEVYTLEFWQAILVFAADQLFSDELTAKKRAERVTETSQGLTKLFTEKEHKAITIKEIGEYIINSPIARSFNYGAIRKKKKLAERKSEITRFKDAFFHLEEKAYSSVQEEKLKEAA